MTDCDQYAPGQLIPVRELRHPLETARQAPTGPHLLEWAPFDAGGSLGTVGTVKLTTVGAPATHALLDCLEDHLDGRVPADIRKRFADVRSLYG
jgi:hypothetical protein